MNILEQFIKKYDLFVRKGQYFARTNTSNATLYMQIRS